ncbi:hypothetical protein AVEN_48868-1 [Araneus ventricosus]|uniref:Uncharacterized protein n=1 Tax=Araneus ventricosus TaxID=182803 RepID=A0A4Y2AHW9_ARAVE|nr:hypothetical protein AVEN_48868-1 [Araneus ventricosus]
MDGINSYLKLLTKLRLFSVDEIMPLGNNVGLNSENITPEEVPDWLECDKMDGGFETLADDEIASSVIIRSVVEPECHSSTGPPPRKIKKNVKTSFKQIDFCHPD